ncbi:hypothetical protein FACS1894105_06210 [Clostridia bacterium]|nr:hypothetical protein FACS1894105_06210 [Clostridia bacterium]
MKKLAGFRVTVGLTQKQAAEALGIHQTAISMWERGDGYPSLGKIPAIAKLYEVTEQEIIDALIGFSKCYTNYTTKEDLDNDRNEQVVL